MTLAQVSSCEFCKNFKNTFFFIEHLRWLLLSFLVLFFYITYQNKSQNSRNSSDRVLFKWSCWSGVVLVTLLARACHFTKTDSIEYFATAILRNIWERLLLDQMLGEYQESFCLNICCRKTGIINYNWQYNESFFSK